MLSHHFTFYSIVPMEWYCRSRQSRCKLLNYFLILWGTCNSLSVTFALTTCRTPLVGVPRVLSRSYSDLSTHDAAVNTDISGDIMSNDQEYNIEGALADEVQLLQNTQQTLYHQIEEKENEIRKLKLEQLTSNLELKTLNEVSIVVIMMNV